VEHYQYWKTKTFTLLFPDGYIVHFWLYNYWDSGHYLGKLVIQNN